MRIKPECAGNMKFISSVNQGILRVQQSEKRISYFHEFMHYSVDYIIK